MLDASVTADLDYHALNAMLNLYDDEGKIQFDADRMAARQYFLQHVNQNTVFFHSLEEKLSYLVKEGFYEAAVLDQYERGFLHQIWDAAFAKKFRFPSFLGAFKYYTSYTLKTRDGQRYLERYEDRVVMNALTLARGDAALAMQLMGEIIDGRFQPGAGHLNIAGGVAGQVGKHLRQSGQKGAYRRQAQGSYPRAQIHFLLLPVDHPGQLSLSIRQLDLALAQL